MHSSRRDRLQPQSEHFAAECQSTSTQLEPHHHYQYPMSNGLTIHCAILGYEGIFQVKINSDQSVLDLKEGIHEKKKSMLHPFDPDQLTLYKVDLPYNEENRRSVLDIVKRQTVKFRESPELAYELAELSDLGGFPPRTLHILVVCPTGESIKTTVGGAVALTLGYSSSKHTHIAGESRSGAFAETKSLTQPSSLYPPTTPLSSNATFIVPTTTSCICSPTANAPV
jgi:hypothetical protein